MRKIQHTLTLALCTAAATLVCGAASAKDEAAACPSVTALQRRIVERADQGMESLRSYVWRANTTYGIEMSDVKASLDGWRAAIVCQEEVARAASQVTVARKADETDR